MLILGRCCNSAMFNIPLKRRKRENAYPSGFPLPECLFPDVCVFLVERRMGSGRRNFLTALAQRKGFCVVSEYSDRVTHVVSEQNSSSDVMAWIERLTGQPVLSRETKDGPHLLDICWFTESMSSGKPVVVEPRHCLGVVQPLATPEKVLRTQMPSYTCQRRTPLNHHNSTLTDALEILARAAFFQSSEVRYLGFTRAASTLKSLPFKLQSAEEAKDLPWCGGHCKTVIQEILEGGVCREVETIKSNAQYQAMQLLTGIYGVGVRTAERWYQEGIRNLNDLKNTESKLTVEQRTGLQYYKDLQQPVTREEAERVEQLVKDALLRFIPDVQITMTGGFRRGKLEGHDVDFLITHTNESALTGLLENAIDCLKSKGLILYYHMKKRKHTSRAVSSLMDGHETYYTICALPSSSSQNTDLEVKPYNFVDAEQMACLKSQISKGWRAVRVDLVVTPHAEYPYALLGWTGSKHFERELRRYSLHEKKMSLNSHGLYDTEKRCYLPAHSEEEIFKHLGLTYISPSDRNA
ncbi:DNA-directed DNA/RNA polymerase mu-like isoform X3 [Pelobates fuscus]|uniref:DNA-directed DNA/RNA polymerase mu-like isoform X3 n=1 Tax=Pelobates fuscus TaxID=191477 RepID=UPI002FE49339